MSSSLADRLDEALARLKTEGFGIDRILADAASIERLFRERGEAAIFMDCDEARDVAWYLGEFELEARPDPGCCIRYRDGGRTLYAVIEGDAPEDLDPPHETPAEEARKAA